MVNVYFKPVSVGLRGFRFAPCRVRMDSGDAKPGWLSPDEVTADYLPRELVYASYTANEAVERDFMPRADVSRDYISRETVSRLFINRNALRAAKVRVSV